MKTNLKKRRFLQAIASTGFVAAAPTEWTKPIIKTIILPVHAQTSPLPPPVPDPGPACSGFETESVNEPIVIVVTDTEVRGPIIVTRSGNTFSSMATSNIGVCADDAGARTQEIEFSGTINTASNDITGDLIVRQFCGESLACEQITTYTATQAPVDASTELGNYSGQAIGTLRCCIDFL